MQNKPFADSPEALPLKQTEEQQEAREAATCVSLGVGVGALGFGAGAVTGAICPLCYVVPPALIGIGVVRAHVLSRKKRRNDCAQEAPVTTPSGDVD